MTDSHSHALRDNLTEAEAAERGKRVLDVRYALHLSLLPGAETYQGELAVEFDLSEKGHALFLDFTGKEIRSPPRNGKAVGNPEWNKHRLVLPDDLLKEDGNPIVVPYVNAYSPTGSGFPQFGDPED